MKDVFSTITHLSNVIEQSLSDTFGFCSKVSCMYKEGLSTLPFLIDLLREALHSENLKETAHSRILYKLLQNEKLQRSFIETFLPDIDYSCDAIQIPYPDKNRIDLTIKGNTFFLIIENKINGACEQYKQIDRYVKIAKRTFPFEEIYVLYLGGEGNQSPSEDSMSSETKEMLGDRFICKNYKDDIAPWIKSVYEKIDFDEQPYLKSSLLCYKTYLENKYNINNEYKEMNNKLDKAIADELKLDSIALDEKIKVIEDQIDNIDKIKERLSSMLEDFLNQIEKQNIREWYNQCSDILNSNPVLTMEDETEFGFIFNYRNTLFRCCVSFDEENVNPYWGIKGLNESISSRPKIFRSLCDLVLRSNKGFHNCEYNSKEWAVSDYEDKDLIVDRFIVLTRLICESDSCTIVNSTPS